MTTDAEHNSNAVDQAVAEGGAYEVIKKRLLEQGQQLESFAQDLNKTRLQEFGSSDMAVAARVRVRTENNCIARDIVQVGDFLLFGYNVFIGLKKETKVEDVLAVFKLESRQEQIEMREILLAETFLADNRFNQDFLELYRYYKQTRLTQLTGKTENS